MIQMAFILSFLGTSLVAGSSFAADLLERDPARFSVRLRSAAYVLKTTQETSLPFEYRIRIPQVDRPGSTGEIVYRWEADGAMIDLGEAPGRLTADAVRRYLKKSPTGQRRYACQTPWDFSDIAPRAVLMKNKNNRNEAVLFAGHTTTYAMRGPTLNDLSRDCDNALYKSSSLPKFESHRQSEWLSSVYTRNGDQLFGLVNNDWRAFRQESDVSRNLAYSKASTDPQICIQNGTNRCKSADRWWWASLTTVVLDIYSNAESGLASFRWSDVMAAASPAEKKMFNPTNPAYDWYNGEADVGIGFIQPSNIIKNPINGFNYLLSKRTKNLPRGANAQQILDSEGFCLIRAKADADLSQGLAWQGLDRNSASGFSRDLGTGKCDFIFRSKDKFETVDGESALIDSIRHISYNSYLRKFLALAKAKVTHKKSTNSGSKSEMMLVLMTSNSRDLTDWKTDKIVPILPVARTEERNGMQIKYEAQYYNLIDHDYTKLVDSMIQNHEIPASERNERRNFDISGQDPWIYISLKRSVLTPGSSEFEHKALDVVRFPIKLTRRSR